MDNDSADESEQVVTMQEFMENQEAEEESADLVLGGDEGKECTYKQGYMPRQAVFSCLTCVPQGNAGVCTACSLTCHDGHEIVELWTKRHFRCDCGNSKFGAAECKLWKEKEAQNEHNSYNHNFSGLYCTCHRPYPNPEDEELGEMLQCCICEDWFHEAHLGLAPPQKVPRDEEGELLFDELICQSCVPRCSFLFRYTELHVEPCVEPLANDNSKKKIAENGCTSTTIEHTGSTQSDPAACLGKEIPEKSIANGVETADMAGCSRTKDDSVCKLKATDIIKDSAPEKAGRALFVDKNWRAELCHCVACTDMYKSKGLSFLLDKTDSLHNYEAVAKQKRKTKLEEAEGAELKLFQNLNHVHKLEFLYGLNDMTSELSSFLGEFRDSGRTVTPADIYGFFDRLKQKRRKLS